MGLGADSLYSSATVVLGKLNGKTLILACEVDRSLFDLDVAERLLKMDSLEKGLLLLRVQGA